jgi:antitoxin FitA
VVNITIRDVPPEVRDALAARAKMRGQSSQEFLKTALVNLAAKRDKEEVLASIDARRATLSKVDVLSLLDRDDDGRY